MTREGRTVHSIVRANTRSIIACALVVAAVAGAACGAAPASREPSASMTLGVPGRSNAHVSMSADGDAVVVAWAASEEGGATDVYVAVSEDAGQTFSAPARVNEVPGDARANGEQPPRVAFVTRSGGRPLVTVVWTARGADGTRLLMATSTDFGRSFGAAIQLTGGELKGHRGWHAIGTAAGVADAMHVVWLDHRRLAERNEQHQAQGHAGHRRDDDPAAAVASAQLSDLYFATVRGQAVEARAIASGVCFCCKTAVVSRQDGSVYAAWRHVYDGNMRDIAFARSADGGASFTPPRRVSEDGWQIAGCPDDGPAMASGPDATVHVVWPTLVKDAETPSIGLFHASTANGLAFTPRQQVPTEGQAHHPQLALDDKGALALVWDELVAGSRRIVFARGAADTAGRVTFTRQVLSGEKPGVYPTLVRSSQGLLAAWTENGSGTSTIRLQRLGAL